MMYYNTLRQIMAKIKLAGMQTCYFFDGMGIEALETEIAFGPGDKECRCLMDFVQTGKIEIAAIHQIDGPGFGRP